MKIYKVFEDRNMGYQEQDKYWSNLDKAAIDFNNRIEGYKRHPELATLEECYDDHYHAEPIAISFDEKEIQNKKLARTASIAIWYRSPYIDEDGRAKLNGERSHIQEYEIGIKEIDMDVE